MASGTITPQTMLLRAVSRVHLKCFTVFSRMVPHRSIAWTRGHGPRHIPAISTQSKADRGSMFGPACTARPIVGPCSDPRAQQAQPGENVQPSVHSKDNRRCTAVLADNADANAHAYPNSNLHTSWDTRTASQAHHDRYELNPHKTHARKVKMHKQPHAETPHPSVSTRGVGPTQPCFGPSHTPAPS